MEIESATRFAFDSHPRLSLRTAAKSIGAMIGEIGRREFARSFDLRSSPSSSFAIPRLIRRQILPRSRKLDRDLEEKLQGGRGIRIRITDPNAHPRRPFPNTKNAADNVSFAEMNQGITMTQIVAITSKWFHRACTYACTPSTAPNRACYFLLSTSALLRERIERSIARGVSRLLYRRFNRRTRRPKQSAALSCVCNFGLVILGRAITAVQHDFVLFERLVHP